MNQDFIDQQLTFLVGVTGVDHFIGIFEQGLDDGDLLLGVITLGRSCQRSGSTGRSWRRTLPPWTYCSGLACSSKCPEHQVMVVVPHVMQPLLLLAWPNTSAMPRATEGFSAMIRRMTLRPPPG
jgi:hypothetical protein